MMTRNQRPCQKGLFRRLLSGLVADTTFHYRARSEDGVGNLAVSSDLFFRTSSEQASLTMALVNSLPGSYSSVMVGDVDNDGSKEIVAGTTNPGTGLCDVQIFKNMVLLASFTNAGSRSYGKIGDVDNDGNNELVIATPNGDTTAYLRVYKFSGGSSFSEVWSTSFATRLESRGLSIGDMDNDGVNEIILAQSFYSRKIDAFRHVSGNTYSLVWTDNNGNDSHSAYVADADNDGQKELVIGSGNWGAWDCRVYKSGSSIWSSGALDNQQVVVGDFNDDGANEILVVSGGGNY